ncbi:hypothetical protein F4781DRAFT_387296 [Annulohypoxylon bovei var. microspora]|nr:hypothetical protein F4781DRAFT_387296 [Annulohypoxylon bovei var. microspora]
MHAFTYLVLSFVGTTYSLPAFLAESKRSLINLSPDIDLGLDLENNNSCLGIGASVCDPITVNSKTNSTVVENKSSSSSSKAKTDSSDSSSGDDSLINISPDLGLDLGLSNDNSCLGLGISACDPITVGSDVTKTVTKTDESTSDETTEQSSYPTASSESKSPNTSESKTTNTSTKDSNSGDSLLNLSPTISPALTLSNDNSCQGIGISACDPITVNSTTTQNARR